MYANLGTAYWARKDAKAMVEANKKALALDPEVFERRSSQGVLLQERSVEERAKYHYYMAKMYAQDGAFDRALMYMRKALEEGFKDKKKFQEDPEFVRVRDLPEFKELLAMEHRAL
jgi:tetratricopeptide (TPR) repeat protein